MMYKTQFGDHDGDSWEELCHFCLKAMLGDSYTEVPASPGDYGLDGFTDNGIAFQFYCPERECTDKELYESQRDKVNRDTKKLNKHKKEIKQLLGSKKIDKWILLTPHIKTHNIISYCNTKAEEIKQYGLDFIGSDFSVKAEDYKYINAYIPSTLEALNYLNDNSVPEKKIDLYIPDNQGNAVKTVNDSLTKNANRKHTARFESPSEFDKEIKDLTNMTIESSLIFDLLKKKWQVEYQEHYERFIKNIELLERQVQQKCLIPSKDNEKRLEEIEELVRGFVEKEFKILTLESKQQIVQGVISDWILRCPLDFKTKQK